MTVHFESSNLQELATEALIVPLLADVSPKRLRGFNQRLADMITGLNRHGDWKGEPNEVKVFYTDYYHADHADEPEEDFLPHVKRLVLVGMGKSEDWNYEKMRRAVASAITSIKQHKLEECTVLLPENVTPTTAKDLASIAVLASFQFDKYKTLDRQERTELATVRLCLATDEPVKTADYETATQQGLQIGLATNYVRDLINHPANMMTPKHLARDAKELEDGETIRVDVYDREAMDNMGMGAILAVALGSEEEPQLIVAEYKPAQARKRLPKIALVGKGITFDSGGISIKPSQGMEEMKMDMAGAATCLGVIAAAKALDLQVHLIAVLPTTENLPSGRATKPGDIVKAYDGKTIEILNTDAEGRLVLADALAYVAKEYKPDVIIDLATLTGAVIVALGHEATAIIGNNPELIDQIKAAAGRTGERVWELPLWDEYKEMVKSDVADLKNIGERGKAGTITGAAFLQYFVPKDIPWVHLDIAGTAMLDKPRPYMPKGGSGWGVRLLVDLLENWK